MGSIAVREARADELDEVSALLDRAWTQFDALGAEEPTYRDYRARVPDVRSRLGDSVLLIAEIDGGIVGTATYYPARADGPSGEWPAGWASFRFLGVDPDARGSGAGRALVEECIRRARAQGVPSLGLHTSEWMQVARGLYERMGFRRMPEMDFHPRPSFVVTAYRLDL